MKKCDISREEMINNLKNNSDKNFEHYKMHRLLTFSLDSFVKNAGVIILYNQMHFYISEMAKTFTDAELKVMHKNTEILDDLVDCALGKLPMRNSQICSGAVEKYIHQMQEFEEDGGMEWVHEATSWWN